MANTTPDLTAFLELAKDRRVIPVVRRLLADGETAVGLYRKLAGERAGTFLLESAEHGHSWSRYSFVGVNSTAMLSETAGTAVWSGNVPVGVPISGDPFSVLRETLAVLHTPEVNSGVAGVLPPLTGGVVGYLGYDIVRRFEEVPDNNPDEIGIPELAMLIATDLAVLDHVDGAVILIANAINYDNSPERAELAHQDAVARLDAMEMALATPALASAVSVDFNAPVEFSRRTSSDEYQQNVRIAQERIVAGDAFQIVLSQRFSADCPSSALDVYRVLRATNPSPYMYLFRVPVSSGPGRPLSEEVAFDVVGSSPEALVRLQQRASAVPHQRKM
jgi:anthranilate synthase component 1